MSKLVGNSLELKVKCFDNFFYVLAEANVRKQEFRPYTFALGDVATVSGKAYQYPEDFDIVDIQGKVTARVRKARLVNMVRLTAYVNKGVPVIEMNGCYVKIETQEHVTHLLVELGVAAGYTFYQPVA